MCNCLNIKYAKRNHTHPYAKQSDIDRAVADLVDNQALIDALAQYVTQTAHDTAVANLQAQIDALTNQHATDTTNLQAQIDTINQALIDCGCIDPPVECTDFANEFSGVLGDVFLADGTDWSVDISFSNDKLRARRIGDATGQYCSVYVTLPNDGAYAYVPGMTLEFSLDNDVAIEKTEVSIFYWEGGYIATPEQLVHTSTGLGNDIQSGIDLSFMADGDVMSHIIFQITALDSSATLARFLLDYVRIVCP